MIKVNELFLLYPENYLNDKIRDFDGRNIGELEVNINSIRDLEERQFFTDMLQDKLNQLGINYNVKDNILPF